jgi:hypothetical protein
MLDYDYTGIVEDVAEKAYLSGDRTVRRLDEEPRGESRGPRPQEIGYGARKATWINHSPDDTSRTELAATFATVSTIRNETHCPVC